jgi:hypothetical protein
VPESLKNYPQVDAKRLGFEAAVEEVVRHLRAPGQHEEAAQQAATPDGVSSPAASISVFVSYSHADRVFEQQLLRDLQAAHVTAWVDHERLTPGTPDWEREIRQGIAKSNAVVYIASEEATISRWVRGELAVADDEGVPIYPIWARGEKWSRCVALG